VPARRRADILCALPDSATNERTEMNAGANKLYRRLLRIQPKKGDPPTIRLVLSRAEIALILPALRSTYELETEPSPKGPK
jgi:hypothetical protein